ncbi:PQQ-binding-like beta-propeller repeat protein [Candidatus Zixiibacteriota bacterium]
MKQVKEVIRRMAAPAFLSVVFAYLLNAQPVAAQDWWSRFHNDNQNTGYSTSIVSDEVTEIWSFPTGEAEDGYPVSCPAIVEGKLYMGALDNYVYCLDAISGDLIWTFNTGSDVRCSPTVAGGRVYIGADNGRLYCLPQDDPNEDGVIESGEVEWSYYYPGTNEIWAAPAVAGGKVYFAAIGDMMRCLHASSGNLDWKTLGIFFHGVSSPALYDGNIFICSASIVDGPWSQILCIPQVEPVPNDNMQPDELVWYTDGTEVSPAITGGNVYAAYGSDVRCLDASTGSLIWTFTAEEYIISSPAVADGMVFVGSLDSNVYCLPQNDPTPNGIIDPGDVIWVFPTGGEVESSPAIADGKVYVGSNDSNLYCLPEYDPNPDGIIDPAEVLWSIPTGGPVSSSPAIAEGIVYLHANDGTIRAYGDIFVLEIIAGEGGTTDPSPGYHSYAVGLSLEVEAIPDACYEFDYWIFDGMPVPDGDNPYMVEMDGDHTLEAHFTLLEHELTITSTTGGNTNPAGVNTYPCSTAVEVTATHGLWYRFDHWELDGQNIGDDNPVEIIVDDDYNLLAVFVWTDTYDLTLMSSAGGKTIPPPGLYTVPCDAHFYVNPDPYPGYVFDYWEFDGVNVGDADPYMVHIDDDHTLQPFFWLCDCGLWGDLDGNATIDPLDVSVLAYFVYKALDARVLPPACPEEAGDANCDGGIDPLDVMFYVYYVYRGEMSAICPDPCTQF